MTMSRDEEETRGKWARGKEFVLPCGFGLFREVWTDSTDPSSLCFYKDEAGYVSRSIV